ncbi:unnamed protein product [Kuraishia capsulata CBS 1993]|uniref:Uncharacterized protein n=1 Tax=Kuraishia capsulata CBS 1993 TaxID=1382522 RepID=W6MW51_9ASCO|nr:uncharacterized protein KUCA_T00002870001 [Kuraishia capsulata CBS 1993]CDK26895.1 unnamed protein product [Kuraishia capsulata CBS 1993]
MPVFEAPAVYVQSAVTTLSTYMIQHLYMKQLIDSDRTAANVLPLLNPTAVYYVRRERANKQNVVNVFDSKGNKVYTFERTTPLNPVWRMLEFPSRREAATVRAGFFLTSADFHNVPGVQHRVISDENGLSGKFKTFYLDDGHKYGWTRGSKFLEKFVNPGGDDEEVRERIAKVRLMRQWKFDFELIVDETKINKEVALATGFVSMMTQWGVGDITETTGPTRLQEKTQDTSAAAATAGHDLSHVTFVMNGADTEVTIEQE